MGHAKHVSFRNSGLGFASGQFSKLFHIHIAQRHGLMVSNIMYTALGTGTTHSGDSPSMHAVRMAATNNGTARVHRCRKWLYMVTVWSLADWLTAGQQPVTLAVSSFGSNHCCCQAQNSQNHLHLSCLLYHMMLTGNSHRKQREFLRREQCDLQEGDDDYLF